MEALAQDTSRPSTGPLKPGEPVSELNWRETGPREHFVQFYESDEFLVKSLAGYVGAGLIAGEKVIVVATGPHCKALEERLLASGVDLPAARRHCRYLALDASETLAKFMVGDMPDEKLFKQSMERMVSGPSPSGLRVFGEMVAVLWANGQELAAIRLEKLWNKLAQDHAFRLFCAYPMNNFNEEADGQRFLHICNEHARVIPAEIPVDDSETLPTDRERLIALLQQQAAARQTEIVRRKSMDIELQRARAIVEFSDDAIISKDLNGIIMSWNQAAQRLFGYEASEIIGKSVTILIPEDRQHEEPYILGALRKGERIEHFDTVRQRKDSTLVEISLTVSPIKDENGKVVGVSKIARDISDRKRIEHELERARDLLARANEDLEKSIQERTASLREVVAQMEQFSYTVSHDLRAPLRAMAIYSTALMEDYASILPSEAVHHLQRISDNAVLLDKMIRDILNFSWVARAELHLERISLDEMVRALVKQSQAGPVTAEIRIDSLQDVVAHGPALAQAVSNLLNNAIKFVPAGVTPKIHIWSESRDGQVRLWVEDNGIGILPSYQHRVFNMFERLHTHLNYDGNGVGLAIVRKSTERMDGSVGMESDGTHGSKFWIQLPATKEDNA